MAWQQIILQTTEQNADSVSDLLHQAGALSVTLEDAADQPVYEPAPNTTPIWKHTQVCALFDENDELESVTAQLQGFDFQLERLEDQDWVSAGQDFRAQRFGQRLWICPSWDEIPQQQDAVNVLLDPGLAFGTGTHPTTALCLQWLDAYADLTGIECIDYGSGSGILAIAALKLGAAKVWAVDNDPQAVQSSLDNATKNDVADALESVLPEQLPALQVPLLIANILANPLLGLAEHFAELICGGGLVVLSGILSEQADGVCDVYKAQFDIVEITELDGWVRICAKRHTE